MAQAPVCNIKGVNIVPNQSVPVIQPVPVATNLASALQAIAVLSHNFNALYNQIPKQSFSSSGTASGFSSKANTEPSPWKENPKARVTEKVTISNPNDPSQSVEVEQINAYSMQNQKTGEVFTWKR